MPGDPRLDLVHHAICAGQIQWIDRCYRQLRDDQELNGFTRTGVNQLLRHHVCVEGNLLATKKVVDEDWLDKHPDDPWVYQTVVEVPQFPQCGLFLKVRLIWVEGDAKDDAFVEIVSIHRGFDTRL